MSQSNLDPLAPQVVTNPQRAHEEVFCYKTIVLNKNDIKKIVEGSYSCVTIITSDL